MGIQQKTFQITQEQAQNTRNWHIVDVSGLILGRAATQIATLLRGKHKATFTPHVDSGDFVVVINANKVVFTGNKENEKTYYRHSLYMGGVKSKKAKEMRVSNSVEIVRQAVWGMLPKGPLGKEIIKKLKVFSDGNHSHQAQQPKPYKLLSMRKS